MVILEEHEFTHGPNKKKTFYLSAGPLNGPLLMFIHGWPAIGKVWKPQLETFAGLGFRVVAPDMPGYGRSSADKKREDYCQENINLGMVALLEHVGREKAVWIGHDWGCGAVWTFAAHYPEKCIAVAGLAVPYGVIELGLEELLKYVDREMYPVDQYPYGQWSYQNFYEENFDKAHQWFEKDPAALIRVGYSKGNPAAFGQPASLTSNVTKDGGWFGGIPQPDPNWKKIPIENTVLDEETYQELVAAMEKTGFWGADAWYANHKENRKYTLEKAKNNMHLHMPVLFIHASFDSICATINTRLTEPMRKLCEDLTEVRIDAGHWVAEEKPAETSAAIARWLLENCKEHWPGYWDNPAVTKKL